MRTLGPLVEVCVAVGVKFFFWRGGNVISALYKNKAVRQSAHRSAFVCYTGLFTGQLDPCLGSERC